ncbi:response regulator [Glaciecola siphonariae]|uniref:histidine kinase n=1 Tax=Glaciecola siphonariae TaxID=521012 RepID=A0ABV9LZV8_9ALTE
MAIWSFALFCIGLSSFAAYSLWRSERTATESEFVEESTELNYRLTTKLNDIVQIAVNNAFLAANSPLLSQSLNTQSNIAPLKQAWQNMFLSTPSLYQIRYLNEVGDEIYRMERAKGELVWIDEDNLQAKGERDYFQKGMLGSELIYVSAIDLNLEQGAIELPYRPTIRATAKYYDGEVLSGLVVLNFDLRAAFAFFQQQQARLEHWVAKDSGFFISTPSQKEWGWLIEEPTFNINNVFPDYANLASLNELSTSQLREQDRFVSVSNIEPPISNVRLEESRFWVFSVMSKSALNKLESLWWTLVISLAVVCFVIIAVARYVTMLVKRMNESQILALQLAEDAQASEKAKAMFLAQMSHEIRTPMNGLFGMLQLTYGERDQQKINHNLKHAMRSFEGLKRIIDDILDFSKIEAGKLELVQQRFGLDVALRDTAQIMGRAAYGKNVDMWIDIDPNCPREAIGDVIRLNQILFNLTNNAIKFTEEGEIKLIVKLLSETNDKINLGFVVKDTGIGMSETQAAEVFSAFTQASTDTHRKFGGTGLGLSIVKQLINLMGGTISVSSESAKGSLFSFDIWLNKAPNAKLFSQPEVGNDSGYIEAVLITPSEVALTILKRSCSTLGWISSALPSLSELKTLRTGQNAQRQVIIIDDKTKLTANDFVLLKRYKQENESTVSVLIAKDGNFTISQADKTAFDSIVSKPFTPSTLYDAVVSSTGSDNLRHKPQGNIVDVTSSSLKSNHILIVEDNEINQMVAATMLENAGATVALANNGKHCLEMLAAHPGAFDAVLMDVQMPEMDGIEATRFIRQQSIYDKVPIIALTANAMEQERNSCIDAGMQSHVAKPIDRAELIQTIMRMIHDYTAR